MAESSFDVVSSVDLQEVKNAISQAMKEITTRFDLKGTGSDIQLQGEEIVLTSSDEFKLKAVRDVLEGRLVKRSVTALLKSGASVLGVVLNALPEVARSDYYYYSYRPPAEARTATDVERGP